MSAVSLARPWLEFDLGQQMMVLNWSVNRPGLVPARRILWREVRNNDLPADMEVTHWLDSELTAHKARDAVVLLTSRDIARFEEARTHVGQTKAHAVVTVGLSNGERVGQRVDYGLRDWGTINVALRLNCGLTEAGLLEALSIAVQARTAAVMDAHIEVPTGVATGTGTDCIAIAAPAGDIRYTGLHTETGEAIGRVVYDAVLRGARIWRNENGEARSDARA